MPAEPKPRLSVIHAEHVLDGCVGVVTGAGNGLGRAFALHLAGLGAKLVVNNRKRLVDDSGRGSAERVVDEITATGGTAVADFDDAGSPGVGERLVTAALDSFGRLDFVVANAAIDDPAMFHKSDWAALERVLRINVLGLADLARSASAHFREQGNGRMVLVASTAGLHGEPTVSSYAASKGAVLALGRTIAVEGARRGVLTNVVLPYATTPMTSRGMDPSYRDVLIPDAVAPVITALVDPRSTINGRVFVTANGALRAASSIEWDTVAVPTDGPLDPATLEALWETSRRGSAHEYPTAQDAFTDFAAETLRATETVR
jgi:NAD(P)-dependent dehydrogenase (short-subunit alcohol dehydrogenase family)